MAHNLNYNSGSGEYSIFTKGSAWHGLSQVVTEAQTSEEALKLAHLDYEVEKQPLYTKDGLVLSNNFATVRLDNGVPLGVVGNRYQILQNKDAFKFIDDIVGSSLGIYESAGALGKGERVFITCKLPDTLVVGKNDVADQYFVITNSFDGSKVLEMLYTSVFVVCENTLREALRSGKHKQRVRHTTNIHNSMLDKASIMGISLKNLESQTELFNNLAKISITDKQLRKYIELAMNPSIEQINLDDYTTRFTNKVDEVMDYALSSPEQLIEERKGTLWGAYNAITGFINNRESYKTPEKKFTSIMYGTGYARSQEALDLAINVMDNTLILS